MQVFSVFCFKCVFLEQVITYSNSVYITENMLTLYDATYKFSKTTIFHTVRTKICIKMQFTIKYLNMQL